ncbi:hypothetical protein [Allorhodopirellula heiligendammensis]|nr:hypothetical protein [Allorhodopirellula heiligendammensis]
MISLGVASASLLAGSAIVWFLRLQDEEFWIFFVVIVFVAVGLGQYVASSMTAPVKVRISDASRGIVQLRFKNASYMARNL